MKISNSKKQLAKIIHENGGWPERALWAAQDNCIAFFLGGKPEYKSGDRCWYSNSIDGACVGTITCDEKVTNWHQTVLRREEYYHAYPKANADGWVEWNGGECPVDVELYVYVIYRDGCELPRAVKAGSQRWNHFGLGGDIMSYRLCNHANMHNTEAGDPNPVAKPEFCKSVMRSIPEPEAKPTIEQLAADYRNRKDYAERKQQEADAAKADADETLRKLEIAGEALGLLVSPITAKQETELVSEVKVGDEVECIRSNVNPSKYMGMTGTVLEIDDSSTPYLVDFGAEKIWCHEVKFIRRA